MWDLYNTYGWGGRLWLGDGIVICLICMLLVSVCDNCILQIAKLIKKNSMDVHFTFDNSRLCLNLESGV